MKRSTKIGSKNVLLILGAILVVAGAFALAEFRNKRSEKIIYTAEISTSTPSSISPELANQDTDADGLKDWEEVLLGTDPRKADTDGDGTPDGKEVTSGRNPLVKGPNDNAKSGSSDATARAKLTQTDIVARDFFARYMELNQMGLASDSQSQAELIGQVLKNGMVLSTPKVYAEKDILVSQDNSIEAIRKYGNEVAAIFKKYNNPKARNEVMIAKESLDNENPDGLKEIDPIILAYKNTLTGLLKTPAPQTLSDNHLQIINAMSTLVFSAESLRKIDKDTLAGIQGSSVWLAAASSLNKSFNFLKATFTSHGIVYGPEEPASYFIPDQK